MRQDLVATAGTCMLRTRLIVFDIISTGGLPIEYNTSFRISVEAQRYLGVKRGMSWLNPRIPISTVEPRKCAPGLAVMHFRNTKRRWDCCKPIVVEMCRPSASYSGDPAVQRLLILGTQGYQAFQLTEMRSMSTITQHNGTVLYTCVLNTIRTSQSTLWERNIAELEVRCNSDNGIPRGLRDESKQNTLSHRRNFSERKPLLPASRSYPRSSCLSRV